MNDQERRKRIAEMLLEELKSDEPRKWYYISMANEKFLGGVFLLAHGPTDAWRLLHSLDLFVRDANADTQTTEVPRDREHIIPEGMKWRRLTKEEVESIK